MKALFSYLISLISFMVMDCLWLGLIMKSTYKTELDSLLRPANSFTIAHIITTFFVWLSIVTGIWIFVMPFAIQKSYIQTYFYGGLFGFVLYGVYEGTNFVVLNKWPLKIVTLDIAWGIFACGILSIIIKKLHS